MEEASYDVIVIGGGPGGATAALFAARAKLKTVIIDKAKFGGSLAATSKIANYPGYPTTVSGVELLASMREQAQSFGAEFVQTQVYTLDLSEDTKRAYTAEGTFAAKAVILATGAGARQSRIAGEEEFLGRGVSYCATCDGAFFQDQEVAVVGESQEALEESFFLAKYAHTVHVVAPRDAFKAAPEVIEEAIAHEKLRLHYHRRVKEIVGRDGLVAELALVGRGGEEESLPISGVFMYLLGNKPASDFLQGLVELDEQGYVITDEQMQTSVPGVYAVGDVRRSPLKQVVTAASDGAIAAMAADRYVHRRAAMIKQWA
ncbi:MAG: thioredoxin-disulfide reductase [Chloroflexota bacterium]|nr:MAG: thioredoxin-disulfide reductase [Chloroflexota bacterium]